jgi:CHAT domain-containing protein
MRLTLLLIFFGTVASFGQDWQSAYQASVTAYKDQNFTDAIARAESAVALSRDLDVKSKAFSLQIFTASCVEANKPEKGLAVCDQEIQLFQTLEPNGKNHLEAIRKKGKLLMLAGKAVEAASAFHDVSPLLEKAGKDYTYYRNLADEGDAYLQASQFKEANLAYSKCLDGLKNDPDGGEDFLYTLFNTCFAHFQLKDFQAASVNLQQFIKLVETNDLKSIPEYEQARKMLSTINSQNPASTSSTFLLAEDELKKVFQSALKTQQTNVTEALTMYSSADKLIAENKLVNATAFSCLLNHARLLYAVSQYESSYEKLKNARVQAEKLFDAKSAEVGNVDILEGDLLIQEGKKADAARIYAQAITSLLKQDAHTLIRQTRWIAEQLLKAEMPADALSTITLVQQTGAVESVDVIERILLEKVYAGACIDSRQIDKLLERLKQKSASEKNNELKQGYLLLYAQAEKESGNYTQALSLLQQAQLIPSNGFLDGEMQLEFARIHQQLGNYKEAENAFTLAVEKSSKSAYAQTLVPQVFNSFATFYIQLGNYAAAEKLFSKLLSQSEEKTLFYNAVKQNFAAMYQQLGRYPEAKRLLSEAVAADKQLLGDNHPDYAISLQNLAAVYQKLGRADSALLLYEQALSIDKNFFGEKSLSYASKLANLGALYQDKSDFDKALQYYLRALEIRQLKLHAEHPDYNFNLFTIGYLYYRIHQNDKALPYLQAASAFYVRQVRDVFPILSDYERTAFYNKIQGVIDGYQSFMVEHAHNVPTLTSDLLNFRLETKALLLNASLKVRNQILQGGDQLLISKFAVWQHTKEQLAYLYSLTVTEQQSHAALIAEYKEKSNELEKWLSVKSDIFAASVNLPRTDWKKIQQALKPNEAALELIRTTLPNDSVIYGAVIIKPGLDQPRLVTLTDGKYLEDKAFKQYINSIRFQLEDKKSYDLYWKKINAELNGVKFLYVSGDGIFNKLNPLTFFNPETKQFVLDQLQIELKSNLKEILYVPPMRKSVTRSALLLGFPDYRLNTTLTANDVKLTGGNTNIFYEVIKSGVADLLGTLHEIKDISESLESMKWQVSSFTGDQATEEKMKTIRNPDVIHIATHGFFIAASKKNAQHVHGTDISNIDNNVMLRSGLLLAGAEKNLLERINGKTERTSEDGVLTAYEIMNLNLDSTRLVVLSACETGVGDIRNGEGVYGLQRAFLLAGVDAVIMSLWKVDDDATQYLMSNFYKDWTTGKERSHAFYNTQLELRKQFPHPYYWGAFVVTGDL